MGFEIIPFIEPKSTYFALRDALFDGKGSGNSLDLREFFQEFNRNIPPHARPGSEPTPQDIARAYPDIEEARKIYFCGGLDNSKVGKKVQPKNLEKTRRFFGQRVYEFASKRNMSTKWTDTPTTIGFYMPA
ncbi:MAG: hypothetical protein K2X55_10135 [Burkholderiaceae bacterium]|nr:hypothetical protein [Burkholderiaceae bacterium]